jgi:phosphoglucosamine mutase
MTTKLFGTDGIRAKAGEFPLNAQTLKAIGQAIGEKQAGKILVGQDTRLSSPWIFEHLKEGVAGTSSMIEDAGVIPTPGVALLTKTGDYAGGVMISASHNPYEDNGIKVFASDGKKVNDATESEIEGRIEHLIGDRTQVVDAIPNQNISAVNSTGFVEQYEQLLLSHFPKGAWLTGMRLVLDCANGATSVVAPELLCRLGAEVVVTNASPNGTNINAGCGAVHLESLMASMKTNSADFGVAFDGDADRSLFVSRTGRLLDGDAVLLMMARRFKKSGKLNPAVVIGTLMTNYSLERMLHEEGIALTRVAVGDRYIFEEMMRSGALLGGEPSGHVIFPDFRLSGDGLLTTLKVAEAIVSEHASFDDLTHDWVQAPQLLKNVRVKQKIPLETLPAIQATMTEVNHELQGSGRLVVRYSGTEPLLRVMIESDSADKNERLIEKLLATIRRYIG